MLEPPREDTSFTFVHAEKGIRPCFYKLIEKLKDPLLSEKDEQRLVAEAVTHAQHFYQRGGHEVYVPEKEEGAMDIDV
jgi:hypothetical protein